MTRSGRFFSATWWWFERERDIGVCFWSRSLYIFFRIRNSGSGLLFHTPYDWVCYSRVGIFRIFCAFLHIFGLNLGNARLGQGENFAKAF